MKKIDLTKVIILYSSSDRLILNPVGAYKLNETLSLKILEPGDYFNTGATYASKGDTIIYVSMEYAKNTSEELLYAVLCHEYGHITLGHCENVTDVADIRKEYEADDFAITIVDKKIFILALIHTVEYVKQKLLEFYTPEFIEAGAEKAFGSVAIRIDRLNSMK